jgi:hypothetical protein
MSAQQTTGRLVPMMTAGACLMEPNDGALRLVVGTVLPALDDQPNRRGLLVEEYEDGHWSVVCPVTDAHFMLDTHAPAAWINASYALRELLERGSPVTLEIERAAIAKATGSAS